MKSGNAADRKEKIKQLEEETEAKRQAALAQLAKEKEEALAAEKREIADKFLKGAQTDDELREELKKMLGADSAQMDFLLSQADKDKARQEQELKEKLAARQKRLESKLSQQKVDDSEAIANVDIVQLVEQEAVADKAFSNNMRNAFQKMLMKKGASLNSSRDSKNQANTSLDESRTSKAPIGDLSLSGIMGAKLAKAAAEAREDLAAAEEERKKAAKEKLNKLVDELDVNLEKDSLLN